MKIFSNNIKKVLTLARIACNNTTHGQAIKQVPDAAKKAIMSGAPIADVVVKMEADWLAAAQRAVENS